MPELPDVERMKQHLDETSLHKEVKRVEVKDKAVLDNSPQTLRRHVKNHSFDKTKRVGKNLFVDIESDRWLWMHFGMTGDLKYFTNGNEPPKYTRAVFHFHDKGALAYISRRKFGSIQVIETPKKFIDKKGWGEDAMNMSKEDFVEILRNKRSMIKSALMDQKVIAGIGNVYADEMLYQSRIHPKTKTNELSNDQLKDLYSKMKRIFRTANNNNADAKEMPKRYLITHRKEGEECPDCSGEIERIKVGGRSTYFCPECQTVNS